LNHLIGNEDKFDKMYQPRLFTTAEALHFQRDLKAAQETALAFRMISRKRPLPPA
jgi:hypothetical protein